MFFVLSGNRLSWLSLSLTVVCRCTMYELSSSQDQDDSFSVVTSGYQWLLVVLTSYQWFSLVTSGYQWFSVVLSGYQWFSVVTSDSQWFSVVTSGSQWFGTMVTGYRCNFIRILSLYLTTTGCFSDIGMMCTTILSPGYFLTSSGKVGGSC